MTRRVFLILAGFIVGCLSPLIRASGDAFVALTGVVSSEAEPEMEGVVVSAKAAGGTITVSVISDQDGRYKFPADRLAPGSYELTIRAIGYDPANSHMVATVKKGSTATADIHLNKTQDLAGQLSSAEWLMSMPGTEAQKQKLFVVCMTCHDLAPILKSTYNATEWKTTLVRMYNWSQASSFRKPILSPNREGPRDTAIEDIPIDYVFIGSCANARIEDLRAAASVLAGKTISPQIKQAMVVPGSMLVKAQAEHEGLDKIFKMAGFEWHDAGCSMCVGMNGDLVPSGGRCASTSNRNFEGRQGKGARTHLVSPMMAAAAAVAGHFVDTRELDVPEGE